MKERPIIFSTPMILAILAGRKTATRRVVKGVENEKINRAVPRPTRIGEYRWEDSDVWEFGNRRPNSDGTLSSHFAMMRTMRCPHGMVGDRLWVREAFLPQECVCQSAPAAERGPCLRCGGGGNTAVYKADATCSRDKVCCGYKSPIHMPRSASRITLEITGVKVERLQEISEEDARAEGVLIPSNTHDIQQGTEGRWQFHLLWESIHGRDSWAANPWLWAISFKVVTPARAGG